MLTCQSEVNEMVRDGVAAVADLDSFAVSRAASKSAGTVHPGGFLLFRTEVCPCFWLDLAVAVQHGGLARFVSEWLALAGTGWWPIAIQEVRFELFLGNFTAGDLLQVSWRVRTGLLQSGHENCGSQEVPEQDRQ